MKKKAAIIAICSLALAIIALIFTWDSCYYQMTSLKTTAYLDPESCKAESRPLKFKIKNDSNYDLIQYGFTLGAFNKTVAESDSFDAYTVHNLIPKGTEFENCFAIPEIKNAYTEDIKKNFSFKARFFIVAFDIGNDKRRMCR